ncbi:hypothetical protein Ddc_13668 [Ditylenchus destructor]|nr:hypothetical protein Ddc_13668 [Ditylenchus destructor]
METFIARLPFDQPYKPGVFENNAKAENTIGVLFFEKHAGTNFASLQDNASCHVSREWCAENGIYLLPWPSYSPDINPAKHVFSY